MTQASFLVLIREEQKEIVICNFKKKMCLIEGLPKWLRQ